MSPEPATVAAPEAARNEIAEQRKQARRLRRARLLGSLIYHTASLLYRTLRVRFVNEAGLEAEGRGAILVTWHGRSLVPANVFRNRGYWALISLSRDGEIQNTVFSRFGFHTIRGSTGRSGVRGALQMARKVKEGEVLAFTPDGPRGPTHKVQHGVLLMAEKSGAPIVPFAVSANRRWLMKSWDSYMVPKPFARVPFVVGDPIYVPSGLDEAGREEFAARIEVAINRVEREAERLAGHPDYPAEWRTE